MVDFHAFNPSPKVLRLIASYIGVLNPEDTIEFLEEGGVSYDLIERNENSSKIIYHIFKRLASSDNTEQHYLLVKIIADSINPALYGQPKLTEEEILSTYNKWLSWDGLRLVGDNNTHQYSITTYIPTSSVYKKMAQDEFEQSEEIMRSVLKQYRDNIADIKIAYSLLLEIVDVYSRQSFPVDKQIKLNEFYVKLFSIVENNVKYVQAEIKAAYEIEDEAPEMLPSGEYFTEYVDQTIGKSILYQPFVNLFLASQGVEQKQTTWEDIKKQMSTCYGYLQTAYHKFVAHNTIRTPNYNLFDKVNKYIQNLSINVETTVQKKQEKQEYAFQLYLDGNKLILEDNIYNHRAILLISLTKQGSSTILGLTIQACKRSPTKFVTITKQDLKGKVPMDNKSLDGNLQKQSSLFKRYISNLGLQSALKDIFYANDPNGELGFKFRNAITVEEWNKKSVSFQNNARQELVKILNTNPDSK